MCEREGGCLAGGPGCTYNVVVTVVTNLVSSARRTHLSTSIAPTSYRVDCRTRGCHSLAEHAVDPHGSCSLRAKRRTAGTRSPAPRPHHRPPCSSPRRVSNEIPPVGMRAHSAQHTVFHTGTSTVLVVARQTGRMPAWWLLGLNSRAVPHCTSHRADTLLSRLPCCGRLARDLRP